MSYHSALILKIEARFAALIKRTYDLEVEEFIRPFHRDRGKRSTRGRFKADGKIYQFTQTPDGFTVTELY